MEREHVAPRHELFERAGVGHAELGGPRRAEGATPYEGNEPEGPGARDHLASDRAESGDAQRLAVEPLGLAELRALPLAGAKRGERVGDASIEREDEPEDELGDGASVLAWAVGDVDAAVTGCANIDRGVLGACTNDEVQLLGVVDRRCRDLRRAHDENSNALRRCSRLSLVSSGS